jgi:hypothetical protein
MYEFTENGIYQLFCADMHVIAARHVIAGLTRNLWKAPAFAGVTRGAE